MDERVYQRPRLELAIRKDVSLTGEPVCPNCRSPREANAVFCGVCGHELAKPASAKKSGSVPDLLITRDRHNQGRGNWTDYVLRVVIILALLAGAALVYLFIDDHYRAAEGRPAFFTPTNPPTFFSGCRAIAAELMTPLDTVTPISRADIERLRDRSRPLANETDTARLASLVLDFAQHADRLLERRKQLRDAGQQSPAPTLRPGALDAARTQQFMGESTTRQWQQESEQAREALNRLLIEIRREEETLAAPRLIEYATPLKRLIRIISGWVKPDPSAKRPTEPTGIQCRLCGTAAFPSCTACDGSGRVTKRVEHPCTSCGGSGRYKSAMNKSESACPFCGATGRTITLTNDTCGECEGLGRIPCAGCPRTPRAASP